MNLRKIAEEFSDMVKTDRGESYSIYKNPTKKEIMEILSEQSEDPSAENGIRLIIDFKNKDVYLFSVNLLHHRAARNVGIPYEGGRSTNRYLFSTGTYQKKSQKIYAPAVSRMKEIPKWLEKYFGEYLQ